MLARAPDGPTPTDAKAPAGAAARIVLGELGSIGLESWSLPTRSPGGSGRGREGSEGRRELVLSTRLGAHSAKLAAAATASTAMDGELVSSGMKVLLKGAIVTSYSVSGSGKDAIETWTIDATSIEFAGPKEQRDGDKGASTDQWRIDDVKGA